MVSLRNICWIIVS